MASLSKQNTKASFERLDTALSSGDLRQIGKSFLQDLRDLAIDKLKPAFSALLSGVGYAVTRTLEPSKLQNDFNKIQASAEKGVDALKSAVKMGVANLRGSIKQSFSNLRAQNIEKVQNKNIAAVLGRLEDIKDPAIKSFVAAEIANYTKVVTSYSGKLLEEFKDTPNHLKGASPVSDIKSLNSSLVKGLSRLVEASKKIDTIVDTHDRNEIMKSYKSVFLSCGDTLQTEFDKLTNPTSKDVARFADLGFKSERLLAKTVKNAVDLYHHAKSKNLDTASAKATNMLVKFGASLADKLMDGLLTSHEIVDLTKQIKQQIGAEVKSKKLLVNLVDALDRLSPADKAELSGRLMTT